MRRLWFRSWAALRRALDGGARDQELSEELRAFVERDAESKIRSGMTPEEARRAALIELGGAEQVKEHVRDARAGARVEGTVRDIRYAIRSLGRSPGFSSSVIGSLSVGLAATIAAFAFINGAMLRPFPGVRDQDRLVEVGILANTPFGIPRPSRTALADYPDVVRALGEVTSLDGLASFTDSDVAVTLPQPRSLPAAFVSPNYFDVLGVQPEIGRTFVPEEGRAESAVAIIGHSLWTREFGRDPSVVGRPVQVAGQLFEIIGVAPRGFAGTTQSPIQTGAELWLPIALASVVGKDERLIRYVGRMRDGVRVDRVEAELGVVAGRLGIARPADNAPGRVVTSAANPSGPVLVEVSGLSRLGSDDAVVLVALILPVPFLVLVLACVNAANLLLVRASGRGREVAVRLALGASRLRLVRQLVIESFVLAVGAAVLALPLAWAGLQVGAAYMTFPMPLDGTVVAGTLVAAFVTALGFGLAPALQASGQRPSAALGTAHAGSGGTRSESRARRALVAGQVALSLGLLAVGFQLTAGLESLAEPPGSDPDGLLMASFDLEQLRFSSDESGAFYEALVDGASRIPGVEAAGLADRELLWTWEREGNNSVVVDPRGAAALAASEPVNGLPGVFAFQEGQRFALGGSAGGDLLRAAGLDLLEGREFVAADRRTIPEVAIVTGRLALQIFQGAALGRTLGVRTTSMEAEVRIVGIVESPAELSDPNLAVIFFPSPVHEGIARTLYLRADGPAGRLAPALRDLVARLDPEVPILDIATLDQKIRADTVFERTLARAAAVLGIVALLLAGMGLYGVTSYSVAMRRREIAVRMALGARADRVVTMVLRQGLALAIAGSVLGGVVAVAAGFVIQAEVFGVPGVGFAALGGSAALLAAAMLLASILPA
ncbi:MAG TPA: ABC transporter permease, partial [Vicinamibacterales bacterium]|nr:ABC transporter permease [Vicinamibacterales bacterium]